METDGSVAWGPLTYSGNLSAPGIDDLDGDGEFTAGRDPYDDWNGNGRWDPHMGTAGVGGPGDVVVYTLTYPWPLLTGLLNDMIGDLTHEVERRLAKANYGAAVTGLKFDIAGDVTDVEVDVSVTFEE